MPDRGAIENVLNRYSLAYDENDMADMADCFAEDAVLTMSIQGGDLIGPFEGRAAIVKLMADSLASQNDQRRHLGTNLIVRGGDEDSAQAVSYLTLIAIQDDTLKVLSTGRYEDELVRQDGTWRLSKRHIALDLPY